MGERAVWTGLQPTRPTGSTRLGFQTWAPLIEIIPNDSEVFFVMAEDGTAPISDRDINPVERGMSGDEEALSR